MVVLILFLNRVTLLLTLATALRAPSRSAFFTVGVALTACLAAWDQVWGPRSTPIVFGLTVVLDALLLFRLAVVCRARKPAHTPGRR
jgi:hypothetical protein